MNIEKIINVDENRCLESYPCQHYLTVQLVDGSIETITMNAPSIFELCTKHNYNLLYTTHFSLYPSNYYSSSFSSGKFDDLLKNGVYYNPSYLHYPSSTSKKVQCDNCNKVINVCIGHGEIDLCMLCVNKFTQ